MKAIVHSRYGPPDALDQRHRPAGINNDRCWSGCTPLPSERVTGSRWEACRRARLRYGLRKPKHSVPGFDLSGRAEAVGSN